MLKIGAAQADITPPTPFLMGGSFLKFPCETVLDPIMASAIVADNGDCRVAMVSCDLGSMPNRLIADIRERVCTATQTPMDCIHIMATHNHSGPTVHPMEDQPFADNDPAIASTRNTLLSNLAEQIAACLIAAHAKRVPARMGHGRGTVTGCAFNRRYIMSNGRSRMHGDDHDGIRRLRAEGPADPELQTVWFEDEQGDPLAILVNYASHPTNFYGMPTVSADFPGVMRNALQTLCGPEVPILYLQGACGNVMCSSLENPAWSGRGATRARRIGLSLAGEALKQLHGNASYSADGTLRVSRRLLELPLRDVPPMPVEKAQAQWAHYRENWNEFIRLGIEPRAMINSTLRLAGYKSQKNAELVELAVIRLGDLFLATVPGEYFVEYQLEIKQRFDRQNVMVTELTNGRIGYIPTPLACALGGYEAIQTRFNPDAGDIIRDTLCDLLDDAVIP